MAPPSPLTNDYLFSSFLPFIFFYFLTLSVTYEFNCSRDGEFFPDPFWSGPSYLFIFFSPEIDNYYRVIIFSQNECDRCRDGALRDQFTRKMS